jgi:hypothetical protein
MYVMAFTASRTNLLGARRPPLPGLKPQGISRLPLLDAKNPLGLRKLCNCRAVCLSRRAVSVKSFSVCSKLLHLCEIRCAQARVLRQGRINQCHVGRAPVGEGRGDRNEADCENPQCTDLELSEHGIPPQAFEYLLDHRGDCFAGAMVRLCRQTRGVNRGRPGTFARPTLAAACFFYKDRI